MDLEEQDLAVLEERLYSSIHHSYEEAPKIPDAPAPTPSTSLRIVSRTSVINNSQGTLPANMKRYWVDSSIPNAGERAPYPRITPSVAASKPPVPEKNALESSKDGGSKEIKKMFLAPYQSLLGNMDGKVSENLPPVPGLSNQNSAVPERATPVPKDAPKDPGLQLKKKKQTKQNTRCVEKKLDSLLKLINKDRRENAMNTLESKKVKANKVRNSKRQHIVAQINLNSSDEDSNSTKPANSTAHSTSDGETDEVIIIPTPPPPQICLDSSDEEATPSPQQFVLPKTKKGKKKGRTMVNSPRCRSPSNSSIMSDDFIGQHDRSRLNDSFGQSIPSDDELECSMEGMSGKGMKNAPEVRQDRLPSISSEDTVCTSGDTTDQEKRSQQADEAITRSKSQSQANNATNAKNKKETAATKKTPSKQKPAKTVPTTLSVEAAISPSVSKRNANSKTSCEATSNDTASLSKTPVKSKTRCKSPATPAMEVARKQQVETQQPRESSGKKVKAKKDGSSLKVTRSMSKSLMQTAVTSTGIKSKTKQIPQIDEDVSSESDVEISFKANTPQGPENKSRRSAASFFEDIGDVSSESDYDESFLQLKKTTAKQTVEKEPKKRIGRKRKQYNSETYSDEDFACLLTDIVRAVSDTEEDEEDGSDTANHVNNDSFATNPLSDRNCEEVQPTSASKKARNSKKKRKLSHVPPEPDSTVDPMQPVEKESAVKKKKKLKNSKSSVEALAAGSTSSTPEIHTEPSEPIVIVEQAQDAQGNERSGTASPWPIQSVVCDSSDDDLQIIETNQESFKKTQTIGPDCAWNEEMKQFYNESWIDEDFNMDLLLRRMPYDSRHWSIVHKDRFPDPPKKEIICSNCGDRGHMRFKCRNAPKKPICYMCGENGHKEPRCPKTICLNCGAKTRTFVRGCKSCARDADMSCFSCGLRGHAQRSCPDLWRRYHSTIEDNVPLRQQYEHNPNARWCSICSKAGHQAHRCNDARKIFAHPIPNMRVSSYMPAYRGEYNRCRKYRNDEQEKRLATDPTARYNLFSTDANDCEFNLHELGQEEEGFYFNFLKSTGLLKKYERPVGTDLVENEMQQPQVLIESVEEAEPLESARPEHSPLFVDETAQPEPARTEQTTCGVVPCKEEPIASNVCDVPVVEENSNYSFSEFHAEETQLTDGEQTVDITPPPPPSDAFVQTENNSEQQTLSDFIPLCTDSVATVPLPEPPILPALPAPATPVTAPSLEGAPVTQLAKSNAPDIVAIPKKEDPVGVAKVLLSQEWAMLLLSALGTEFLNETGKKYNVQLNITFESVGNVLLITGTPEAQEKFHNELVFYLTEKEYTVRNEKYFKAVGPKMSNKMTRYIVKVLRCLVEGKHTVASLLHMLSSAKKAETIEKHRRQLNVVLFGVYGLRDGRKHLNVLRSQLALCMKANPWKSELPQNRRTIIDEAIRYIFSAYDHRHYSLFVKEYEELKLANKLKKLTFNDLGIPRIIQKPKTLHDELNKQRAKEIRKANKERQQQQESFRQKADAEVDKHYQAFLRQLAKFRPRQIDNMTAREHGQPSTSNVSRFANRATTLRDQEWNQLQKLHDMLR